MFLAIYLTGCLLNLGIVIGNNFENDDPKRVVDFWLGLLFVLFSWFGLGLINGFKMQDEKANYITNDKNTAP